MMNCDGSVKVKVALLISQHFSNAPRAQKEAAAIASLGAEVTVFGSWWNEELAEEDLRLASSAGVNYVPLLDQRPGKRGCLIPKLRARLARELYTRTKWVLPEAFGTTPRLMLRAIHRLRPDLTMVHCEAGLWAGCRLIEQGYCVGVDFEDWFSEDLLPEARKNRPVSAIAEAEIFLLKNCKVCFATSSAMARTLAGKAGLSREPLVVPNCFPWKDRAVALDGPRDLRGKEVSFYWYSQTIGPGRGLEALGQSLRGVHGNWKLRLRGVLRAPDGWLEQTFPPDVLKRTEILSPVPNHELLGRHMSHDVGLALEIPFCKSRDLTATNKIFDYLRAGLAVIATNTAGQSEVMADCPDAGWVIPAGENIAFTTALQTAVDDPVGLLRRKQAALEAAERHWSWERYEPSLVRLIGSVLSEDADRTSLS